MEIKTFHLVVKEFLVFQYDKRGSLYKRSDLCLRFTLVYALPMQVNFKSEIVNVILYSYHTVPIQRAHGVDVQPSLKVDTSTNIEIFWDPNDIFPDIEDPNSFSVDVFVYTFKNKLWDKNSVYRDLPNNGQATIKLLPLAQHLRDVISPAVIHVSLGDVKGGSMNVELIRSISNANIPIFPQRVGIWSGVLFATQKNTRRGDMNSESCTKWEKRQVEINLQNTIPCPPTIDRARLPNSGLEELQYESLFFTSNSTYHSQLMDLFHSNVSKCFVQAIVSRYIIKQLSAKVY